MAINGNGNGNDRPGVGVDELKRKEVSSFVFETTLSVDQCKRILDATAKHDVNFRVVEEGGKSLTLVESMRKDRWVWTDADPIRLHLHVESGEIVCSDGQHRLASAVKARRVLRTLVLWGDAWKAGMHVDRNKNRNVAQFLRHEHGFAAATVYVAASRLHLGRLLAYQENFMMNYARMLIDDESIVQFVLDQKEPLLWAINRGSGGSSKGFSTTGYHVFLYELQVTSPAVAEQFHADMANLDLDPLDPLAQLRRSVGRRYNDTGIRANVGYTLNNLVKAHNMRSANEQTSKWVNVQSDQVMLPAGFRIDGKRVRSNLK